MSKVGERVREERIRLGIKQDELGVAAKTQRFYESGNSSPDAEYLQNFASLGADVLYIITGQRSSAALPPDLQRLTSSWGSMPEPARVVFLQMIEWWATQKAQQAPAPAQAPAADAPALRVAVPDAESERVPMPDTDALLRAAGLNPIRTKQTSPYRVPLGPVVQPAPASAPSADTNPDADALRVVAPESESERVPMPDTDALLRAAGLKPIRAEETEHVREKRPGGSMIRTVPKGTSKKKAG